MARTKVGQVSTAKEAQLKLRLTPTVDKRLAMLSALTGETKTSLGGAAMLMGLRLLENSILGEAAANATIGEQAEQLRKQFEEDAETVQREAAARDAKSRAEPEVSPVGRAFGRRDPKAELDVVHTHGEEYSGYMRGL